MDEQRERWRGDAGAVWLIEDGEDDIALTRRAFRRHGLPEPTVLRDGAQAIEALHRLAQGDRPAPALILLDLNLPKIGGLEVLGELKRHPALRQIPVVALSSSRHERDVSAAYAAGVNSYVVKPVEYRRFVEVLDAIAAFWLETAEGPPSRSATRHGD